MPKHAGRRVGSKVKLTPFARRIYPQFHGKIGRIVAREIHTQGHGMMRVFGGKGARYTIAYYIRWEGEPRDYILGANWLQTA